MDIPLAYIIFDIMISLKKNNRDTMIYRDILIIYLKRFINSFDLDKDVLEDLIFDFNFANELSFFLDDYEDYFEMEDGIIRLNSDVSINELKKLQEENVILEDFDEEFISDVEKVIHNDISFLEIIGINPNIQVYNALLELEEKLEYKYLDLSYDGLFDENTIEKTREEIKLLKVITNIMYININNNFSSVDYDNLYLYAKDRAKLMHGEESEVKLSRNPPFDRTLLIKTPMDKALFINDSSAKGAIKGRLKMNNKKNKKKINMQDMTKLNFYLMYLELLDKDLAVKGYTLLSFGSLKSNMYGIQQLTGTEYQTVEELPTKLIKLANCGKTEIEVMEVEMLPVTITNNYTIQGYNGSSATGVLKNPKIAIAIPKVLELKNPNELNFILAITPANTPPTNTVWYGIFSG